MEGKELLPFVLTVGAMIVAVTIAGIVLFVIRGRLFSREGSGDVDPGGVLETMRAMRDRGEVSEEEYRTAQASLVAKATASTTGAVGVGKESGPARNRTGPGGSAELRAKPGFDLTGERLPPVAGGGAGGNAAGDDRTESG